MHQFNKEHNYTFISILLATKATLGTISLIQSTHLFNFRNNFLNLKHAFISSFMEEITTPTLNMLIYIISTHIGTTIHENTI